MDMFYMLAAEYPMIPSWHMRPQDIWDLQLDMFKAMADSQKEIIQKASK